MKGKNSVKLIEVRTIKGEPLCSLKIMEIGAESINEGAGKEPVNNTNKGGNPGSNDMMSFAQKRYLFRLLAEQGIEGDTASENLKERFNVASLQEVTKAEASHVIERLLEELKGGDGHGSSK